MAITTVTDLETLQAALTARSEEIHITQSIPLPTPLVLEYSVVLVGSPAEDATGPVKLTGAITLETSPNTDPINVTLRSLTIHLDATNDSMNAVLLNAKDSTLHVEQVTIEAVEVMASGSQYLEITGIRCVQDATLYVEQSTIQSPKYGITVVDCTVKERMSGTTITANSSHIFQATKETHPDGFWSNSDVLIEDSHLTNAYAMNESDIDGYRTGTILLEVRYNHCSIAVRRTILDTVGESNYDARHFYVESCGNLLSIEQCTIKLPLGDVTRQAATLIVGSPLADSVYGTDFSKSTISMNGCTFDLLPKQPILISNYGCDACASRIVAFNEGSVIPDSQRVFQCLVGNDEPSEPYRWTSVQSAINATTWASFTCVVILPFSFPVDGLTLSGDRTVYLQQIAPKITATGYVLVTGKAKLLLGSVFEMEKENGNRLMVDGLSSMTGEGGATISFGGTELSLPLVKYDSILNNGVPEFGTVGSANDGAPFNNAVLKEMIEKLGNRIFCIVLDNSIKIMIGYPSSMVKSVKDIQLVTSNGVDLMLVRQYSPTAEQKRRGVTYVTAHDTALIQYVMYMDPGFEKEGIDPLLIH